jgi:hypothetical protein
VNHPDRDAVGNCGRCHRFFCGTCLGLDSKMQPICASCEKEVAAGTGAAPSISGEGFKSKMAQEDPLGLLGTPAPFSTPSSGTSPASSVASEKTGGALEEDAMETDLDVPTSLTPKASPTLAAPPMPTSAPAAVKPAGGSLLDDLMAMPLTAQAPKVSAPPQPAMSAGPRIPPSPSIPPSAPAAAPAIPTIPASPPSGVSVPPKPAPAAPLPAAAPSPFNPVAAALPGVRPVIVPPSAPSPTPAAPVKAPTSSAGTVPLGSLDDLLSAPKSGPAPVAAGPQAPSTSASSPAGPGGLDDFLSAPIAKPKLPTVSPVIPAKVTIDISAPVDKPPVPKLDPAKPLRSAPTALAAKPVSLPDEDLTPQEKGPGFMAQWMGAHLTIAKFQIPYYALAAGVVVLLGLVGLVAASSAGGPSVKIADSVAPFQIVQVDSGQIADMDITAYSDIQTKLQAMQFTSFTQMTVPELPSPNFFNVQMKPEAATYAEIIKMPGQLKPVLSYVTVFTNGVWFSTNGWDGKNQEMEYLVSEFDPNDDPDQLYVAHIQELDKLKSDRGWETQAMSQDRYMAALTDHVRWYMDAKNVAGYQANFADWH